jgi:hypothetical protein
MMSHLLSFRTGAFLGCLATRHQFDLQKSNQVGIKHELAARINKDMKNILVEIQ